MPKTSTPPKKHYISLYAIASTDPWAFTASMFLFIIIGTPLALFINSKVSGWQPKESWLEIVFGVSLLTIAIFLFLHYRKRKLSQILFSGHLVSAKIERYTASSQWVTVRLSYIWQGKMVNRSVWLAYSKRSSRLKNLDEVIVAIDTFNYKKVVITDLYHQ